MLCCGLVHRGSGRAIADKKIQEYFKGNVFVELRKGGPENKRFYRFFADSDDQISKMSPWSDDQFQLWQAFVKVRRDLGDDTRLFMKT